MSVEIKNFYDLEVYKKLDEKANGAGRLINGLIRSIES